MSGSSKEAAESSLAGPARGPRVSWFSQLRGGIALRLLVLVLLFSSAVTFVLTAVQLYLDYRFDVHTIEQRLTEVEKGYLSSLAEGLWQLDQRQLELQIKGIA